MRGELIMWLGDGLCIGACDLGTRWVRHLGCLVRNALEQVYRPVHATLGKAIVCVT